MNSIKTYSEQIIDHIKMLLLQGTLQPGDKVNEVHLAAELSISRAPIREALQLLTKEGLIVSIPQRGKFIKAISPQEIRENYFIGGVLEGAAVGSNLASFTPADITALEECIDAMKRLGKVENYPQAFTQADMQFHNILISHSDNKLICEYSRSICQRTSKFLLFRHWPLCFSLEEIVSRHQHVLDALLTKDQHTVEMAVRKHYNDLGERMAAFGCETPSYNVTG